MRPAETVLVYRDRLGVASEIGFLSRQYGAFERLRPLWIGRHEEALADALPGGRQLLGGPGSLGLLLRLGFRLGLAAGVTARVTARITGGLEARLVHAQFARGGALALPLAEALGLPLVVTLHGGDIAKQRNWTRGVLPKRWPRLVERAAGFVLVSRHLASIARSRGVPDAKLHVQPIGAPLGELVDPARPEHAPFLFVGRLVEKKGIDDLVEAFGRLRRAVPAARLSIVGEGPLRSVLEGRAASIGGVVFEGWLDPAEIRLRMAASRALVVPSRVARNGDTEGLPSVVVEAMASSMPVLGTRHGGIPEAVEHGRTGLLVDEGDPEALAAAMARLNGEPGLGAALGRAGRDKAEAEFDAARCSAALESLLLRLSGPGDRRVNGE